MPEGHPDFKSIAPLVQDSSFLFESYSQNAHRRRYESTNRCPPWERGQWDCGRLDNFDIDMNSIDRVYHLKPPKEEEDYDLYGRMDYKGRPLYFHIHFRFFHKFRYWCIVPGSYLTFDPEVFLKSVLDEDCNPYEVWKTMIEDGLALEEPTQFDYIDKEKWSKLGVPSLKYLCHMAVYENRQRLSFYQDVLPSCLGRGTEKFIRVRETRDDRRHRMFFPQTSIHVSYSLYP